MEKYSVKNNANYQEALKKQVTLAERLDGKRDELAKAQEVMETLEEKAIQLLADGDQDAAAREELSRQKLLIEDLGSEIELLDQAKTIINDKVTAAEGQARTDIKQQILADHRQLLDEILPLMWKLIKLQEQEEELRKVAVHYYGDYQFLPISPSKLNRKQLEFFESKLLGRS